MTVEALWIPPAAAGLFFWWQWIRRLAPEQANVVPTDSFRTADGVFAGFFSLYFLLGIFSSGSGPTIITIDGVIAGMVIYSTMTLFVAAFFKLRGYNIVRLFGLNRHHWRIDLLPALAGVIAIYPTVILSAWVSNLLLNNDPQPDATIEFLRTLKPGWDLALTGLMIVIVAPITEEILFRGTLYGVAKKFAGRTPALLATSLLFAAIHLNYTSLLPLFILSATMTLAYERTGSLWTPIAMHMIFNGGQFLVILFFPQWLS